ncbi:MAG: hypothetical protein ACEQSR_01355 [Candidatus Methylacidiphilales bacterium]
MHKSKSELEELAAPIFEDLGVKTLFATADCQFFLLQSRANLHAGKKLQVITITKQETEIVDENAGDSGAADGLGSGKDSADGSSSEAATLSVKALTEKIAEETDLKLLTNLLHDEVIGLNRKTAVEAIEKRIAITTDMRKGDNNG